MAAPPSTVICSSVPDDNKAHTHTLTNQPLHPAASSHFNTIIYETLFFAPAFSSLAFMCLERCANVNAPKFNLLFAC